MKICFASHNEKKVEEIRAKLPGGIELLSLSDIGLLEEIEETGQTLEENSFIKASYVANKVDLPVFADDTGLEVESLNGDPGVYSARYSGKGRDSLANMELLLSNMNGIANRKAQFRTVISLISNSQTKVFEGIVKGRILNEMRGEKGFGYDPIFQPDGYEKSFAELSMEEKNRISHRALAFEKLLKYIQNEF